MPVATLIKASGKTIARLEVADLPEVIAHDGQRWRRVWTTASGAAYEVERIIRPRATGAARWVRASRPRSG